MPTRKPLGKAADVKTKPARPGHGGKREGAGRPGGPAAQRSKKVADEIAAGIRFIEEHAEFGNELPPDATPLDVMLMAMRRSYKIGGSIMAAPYAEKCAPYIHARIAQMELVGNRDKPVALLFRWQEE